jgi:hypothetical protein
MLITEMTFRKYTSKITHFSTGNRLTEHTRLMSPPPRKWGADGKNAQRATRRSEVSIHITWRRATHNPHVRNSVPIHKVV